MKAQRKAESYEIDLPERECVSPTLISVFIVLLTFGGIVCAIISRF